MLRGVALFGILVVNLPLIGLPFSEAMGGPSVWTESTADAWTAGLVRALFENKFMALFSLLFGMGLALQVDRAEARGVAPRSFYPRRLIALACFGALNATLVFFGDILLPYAVAGTVLYLLRRRSPRAMLWLAAGFLVIGVALSVLFEGVYADEFGDADAPEGADGEPEEEVEESDWIYESVVFLDLSTHDPEFPSGDVSDTCEGAFTLTVDADGVVTGEATCRQATYANHVSLSVDAEVVGPDIVGDGTITYNGRSFDFPIEGMFAEDQLTIRIETSWSPTARLTQVFEGGIEGLR